MARTTVRFIAVAAAMLVSSTTLAAQGSYSRQLSAPAGGHLTFDTNIGSVAVVGRQVSEVIVHARLNGSRSFLARVHISTEQTPSGVTISAHVAHDSWRSWLHWFGFHRRHAHFTVEVPSDYPAQLRTSGGDIRIRHLDAAVHAATSGGDAHVQDVNAAVSLHTSGGDAFITSVTGTVTVHTAGGDITAQQLRGPARLSSSGGDVEVENATGAVQLSTGGGDVRVRNAGGGMFKIDTSGGDVSIVNSPDALNLSTGGGDVRIDNGGGRVRAVTSGGDIRAQLTANQGIDLRSDGGDITLLLPRNARGSIDAQSSGGVTCAFPLSTMQVLSGTRLLGTMGGGGAPISLHASGGDIHIGRED